MKLIDNKINWVCLKERCPNNCCKYFSSDNVCIESGIKNNEIPLLENEAKKVNPSKKLSDENYYLNINEDSSCPNLKNGRCNIYSNKPAYCTAYPFYIDLSCGLSIDKQCPGLGAGWTDIKELKRELESMILVYKYWENQIDKKV